jgi:hypothetical protein
MPLSPTSQPDWTSHLLSIQLTLHYRCYGIRLRKSKLKCVLRVSVQTTH